MAAFMTIDQIDERVEEINTRRQELDKEFAGQAFPQEARDEWNDLLAERDEVLLPLKKEFEVRNEEITSTVSNGDGDGTESGDGATFQIQRAGRRARRRDLRPDHGQGDERLAAGAAGRAPRPRPAVHGEGALPEHEHRLPQEGDADP